MRLILQIASLVLLAGTFLSAQDNGNLFHESWADNEGNLIAGWTIAPSSFDFDNDGWGEFCAYDEAATEKLGLIFEADGDDSYHFVTVLPYGGGSLAITDWDNDGMNEVTIVDDQLLIFEWTGEDDGYPIDPTATWAGVPKFSPFGHTSQGAPAIFDIDADGQPEIVCNYAFKAYHVPGNRGYYLSIFSFNGDLNAPDGQIEFTDSFDPEASGFSWGDLDNDGVLDIVTAVNQNPHLRVFTSTGSDAYELKYEWEKQEGTLFELKETYTPMVVDFDQDGFSEIIYCDTHGKVYVISGDLSQSITADNFHYLGRFPFVGPGRPIADMRSTNPGSSLGDQDGDGKPDLYFCDAHACAVYDLEYQGGSITDSTSYNWYMIWKAQGEGTYPWPSTMLCLGDDMDQDNKKEIVLIQRNGYRQDPPGVLVIESDTEVVSSVETSMPAVVNEFRLYQNYPNPFNPSTTIRYELDQPAHVQLAVYDLTGKKVATLVDEFKGRGHFECRWNGEDDLGERVANGVYLYVLKGNDAKTVRKMTLLR